MQVIRDEENGGIFMIPLFVDWEIRRCNVKDCTNKPSTILTQVHPDAPTAGICEVHYQENLQPDGSLTFRGSMVFDDFDAFEANP